MNFIEKLQSADEHTKRKWLIVSTLIVMVVVVYFWLAYFNSLISGFSQAPAPAAEPTSEQGTSFTFWQTLKRSSAIIYEIFSDKLHALGEILQKPREFIIRPPN